MSKNARKKQKGIDGQGSSKRSVTTCIDYSAPKQLIAAYGEWVNTQICNGWKGYFVTFMFDQLSGGERAIRAQILKQVEQFYSTLVTRVERKPRSLARQPFLPKLIACLDLPKGTRHVWNLEDVVVNDGWHLHAIVLIPRQSRLQTGLIKHIRAHSHCYIHEFSRIRKIHIKRIENRPLHVTDYVLKFMKRDGSVQDDLLILPKTLTELSAA
jgi:hypothetical protein